MSALSYNATHLVIELIKEGHVEALDGFMKAVFPHLDQKSKISINESIQIHAPSSENSDIRNRYGALDELSSEAAYQFILRFAQGKITEPSKGHLENAINRLTDNSLSLCLALTGYEFKFDARVNSEALRSERALIIQSICDHAIKNKISQKLEPSYVTPNNAFDVNVGNRAIASICKLMTYVNRRSLLSSAEYLQRELFTGGIDKKLSVSDLPLLENDKLLRPELLVAASQLGIDMCIPVLHKVTFRDNFFIRTRKGSDITIKPLIRNREEDEYQSIVANQSTLNNAHFYALADIPLMLGLSVPSDMAISLISIDDLSDMPFDSLDPARLEELLLVLSSLWVNPFLEVNRSPNSQEEVISIKSLVNNLIKDNGVEAFINSPRMTNELLIGMANAFTVAPIDAAKTTQYTIYENRLDGIINMYKHFGVLPTHGQVFLSNNNSIHKLADAGIELSDTSYFRICNQLPRGATFSLDALRRLVDIGGHIGLKDIPSDAAQALKYAKARTTQPIHTAYLRNFDFDELMSLAKDATSYSVLLRAFPEKGDALMPHLSENEKRSVLSHALDI